MAKDKKERDKAIEDAAEEYVRIISEMSDEDYQAYVDFDKRWKKVARIGLGISFCSLFILFYLSYTEKVTSNYWIIFTLMAIMPVPLLYYWHKFTAAAFRREHVEGKYD